MKLKIHPLFWVFLLLYLALGAFFKIGLILFTLLVHEGFHLLVYQKLFRKPVRLTLLPFGGVIETTNPVEFFPGKEFMVALAGPLANVFLIFFLLGLINKGYYDPAVTFLLDFNFLMAAFNLLPVLPLDGGRMLRSGLTKITSLKRATKIVTGLSLATSILVVAAGCYGFMYGITGIDIVILGGFLIILAVRERTKSSFYFLQNLTAKEKILNEQKVLNSRVLTVSQSTPLKEVVERFWPAHYQYIVVIGGKQERLGVLSEREIMEGIVNYGLLKPVGELLSKS
ncbi:site-2 protease family protein [Carboxydothermus pertinax]|uniref:Membrane-associated zinc metalloprotease n=1 Tax=Carboxydothermus pertinax TaxID=870242 RepID=A0A1L8CRZ6_9THEO|nr:site-2 protease family protein [Carboxydothermus pertinax]GAV21683.1 membrane-associated zinc metalloprotease [Carboxydothermus pertinax]